VAIEGIVPEAKVLEGAVSGPEVPIAPETTEDVRDDTLLESSMDVVIRFPEIQDAEPIRSAPMSEAAVTSRGGLELLADDLIDPAMVARNLVSMRWAEQWMKVRDCTLELLNSIRTEYSIMIVALSRMLWRDPDKNLICSRDTATQCSEQKR
jgi:hypothetical protein